MSRNRYVTFPLLYSRLCSGNRFIIGAKHFANGRNYKATLYVLRHACLYNERLYEERYEKRGYKYLLIRSNNFNDKNMLTKMIEWVDTTSVVDASNFEATKKKEKDKTWRRCIEFDETSNANMANVCRNRTYRTRNLNSWKILNAERSISSSSSNSTHPTFFLFFCILRPLRMYKRVVYMCGEKEEFERFLPERIRAPKVHTIYS